MVSRRRPLLYGLGLVASACSLGALAAGTPDAAAPAASAAQRAAPPADGHRIIEDDGVRIDELRIRGEVRSISVQSKLRGTRPYEVRVRRSGRDPSQDESAAGRSVWSLLDF